jgi:hypothetical protein
MLRALVMYKSHETMGIGWSAGLMLDELHTVDLRDALPPL